MYHSFHNKLKTTYLNGKVNRRVDFLIDALLRIERDSFFVYMRRKQLFEINYQAVHTRGMKIPPERVQVHVCGAHVMQLYNNHTVILHCTCTHVHLHSYVYIEY